MKVFSNETETLESLSTEIKLLEEENQGEEYEVFILNNLADKVKPKDLLLIRKFVRRRKGSKRKIVHGQIFERAANLGLYYKRIRLSP